MIWILLPAFNEEASLSRLLSKLGGVLGANGSPYRIVVVDDGSVDRTAELLREYARQLPIDVITHALNRGLGETERDGFEFVGSRCHADDVIVRIEADDTHEPRYIFDLVAKLQEGYDVVIASRFRRGGREVGLGWYRRFVSRGANLFMRVVFGISGVRDYSCGYRVYRARVIQDAIRVYRDYLIQLRGLGFTSTLEMIVKLHLLGCRFGEIPFILRYDQKASSSKMVTSLTALGYLIMAVLYHWPFGGWASQYRGLRKLYRTDSRQAVERFASPSVRRGAMGGVR